MRIDRAFADSLLRAALDKGADMAEVYVRQARSLKAEARDGNVHALEHSSGFAYSVRAVKDKRLGFSYSNEPDQFREVAQKAMDSLAFAEQDAFLSMPLPEDGYPDLETYDPDIAEIESDKAIEYALNIEKAAYKHDKRVSKTRKSTAQFSSFDVFVMNSNGLAHGYSGTNASASLMVVAEGEGDSQMGWGYDSARFLDSVDFLRTGQEAARRAAMMLGAKRATPGKVSTIIDNSVSVDFLSVLASMLSSESVQKKKSLLEGKLGQVIINDNLSLMDDPLTFASPAIKPMDAEGVRCRRNSFIENGVLRGFMHNTYTANKGGAATTANAVRGGASTLPAVGPQSLILEAPSARTSSVQDLVSGIDRGILIMDAMGVHTINSVSGEFSIGVSGMEILGGKLAGPVKEAVLSGNILDLFSSIEFVGDDLRYYGSMGAPSLLASNIDLSA